MQVLQSNPSKVLQQMMDSNLVEQLDENFSTCAYNKLIFQLFFHNFSQLFFFNFSFFFFDTFFIELNSQIRYKICTPYDRNKTQPEL